MTSLEEQAVEDARFACAQGRTDHLTIGDLQLMHEVGYTAEEIASYHAAYGTEIERLALLANGDPS